MLRASRCLNKSTFQESSTILAIQRQVGFFAKRFQSKLSVGSNFRCTEHSILWGGGHICCWGSVGSFPSLKRSVSFAGSGLIGTCLLHHLLLLGRAGSGEVVVRTSGYSRWLGVERYILTLASVLINQEYGLYPLKQRSYFGLANYCCSAETQQLSVVLVPPPSNCKVDHCN